MSEGAYRAMPGFVTATEHATVLMENEALRKDLSSARANLARRETLHAFGRGVGWFSVTFSVGMLLVLAFWFGIGRGMAWGERARRNAEREATVYVTRLHGAPSGVACGNFVEGQLRCAARVPGWNHLITLECDDDEPIANDGCYEVSP